MYKGDSMIANFNGIFYLVVFLLVMSINAFYAYNTLFNPKNFISKYGVDMPAAFFARFVGAFISAVVLMQHNILFRGTVATWAFFNFMFVAMTLISAANFYSFEISKLGNTPQSTRESWIPTSILAILWAILCYGLSDKVYI